MKNQFVSVKTIFAKLQRDFKSYSLNESDVIEWVGEAIGGIGVTTVYEPAIRFIEVKNFSCQIPELTHAIIQIAKNNKSIYVAPTDTEIPEEGVLIDSQGTPVQAYEIAYYRPFFDITGAFVIGNIVPQFQDDFIPVRLATNTFFDSLVCQDENFDIYNKVPNVEEYSIQDGVLKFSFPEGQIAISYLRIKLDCDGFPMIPDTYSVITAVTKYCIMKIMENDFYSHRQGSESRLQKAENDWQWYCLQASNEGKIPSTLDEWENLLHQHRYILPKKTQYNNFFHNLSRPELKNYFK